MKKKIILYVSLIGLVLFIASWGVVGHRAIGKIAENHLTPNASKKVKDLLGSESMAMVSTYADEIRPYKEFDYTASWHYVNLPQGLSFADFSTQLKNMDKPNIYKALLNTIDDLKNPAKTKQEKVFALKFLIHLVGDMHQPMHTGRAEDLGGNNVKVKLNRRELNLHGLWDSSLIDYAGLTYSELAKECDKATPQQIKQWQSEDIIQWIYESYLISTKLYEEADANPEFDYTYYPKYAGTVKLRINQAGVRIAGLLNKIYK